MYKDNTIFSKYYKLANTILRKYAFKEHSIYYFTMILNVAYTTTRTRKERY